jgi:hypothetical protein
MEWVARTWAEQPEVRDGWYEIVAGAWPEFLSHDRTWAAHHHLLGDAFPDYQFVLLDGQDVVAGGNCIPFPWDGDPGHLPDGIDGVLPAAAAALENGDAANTASALQIVVRRDRLGTGLSRVCINVMARLVTEHGLAQLVAPVRPTYKDRYPLIPLEQYARWRRDDGELFDPWLRTHERAGAESF